VIFTIIVYYILTIFNLFRKLFMLLYVLDMLFYSFNPQHKITNHWATLLYVCSKGFLIICIMFQNVMKR